MLRKYRFTAPPDRIDDLIAATRAANLTLDDYGIDSSARYGWPMVGDGSAFVLPVVDDRTHAPEQVAAMIRTAHRERTGEGADWVRFGGSFVCLPDGLESEWYGPVVALAERLHAREAAGDTEAQRVLRAELDLILAPARERAGENLIRFDDDLVFRGVLSIDEAGRGPEANIRHPAPNEQNRG